MKSALSTYIRRILVVAITGVMGSPIWGQEIETAVCGLNTDSVSPMFGT